MKRSFVLFLAAVVSALKRLWPAAGLAAVLLLAVACQGEESDLGAEGTAAAVTPTVSATAAPGSDEGLDPADPSGIFWAPYYKSLHDVVRVYGTIVVGRVTGYFLQCDNRPGYLGEPQYADCALHPGQEGCPSAEELSRPPGRAFSVYSVEVQQVIASESLRVADTIGVMQAGVPGAVCVNTPPEVAAAYDPKVAYDRDYDTRIEIGSAYLFFLRPRGIDTVNIDVPEPWGTTYSGPSYGRFLIDADGRLQIVARFWTCPECAAPEALAGKTVLEAETTLRPLMEQTRLTPTPTPQPGTPTPAPTPSPSRQPGTPTPAPQLGTPTPTPRQGTP